MLIWINVVPTTFSYWFCVWIVPRRRGLLIKCLRCRGIAHGRQESLVSWTPATTTPISLQYKPMPHCPSPNQSPPNKHIPLQQPISLRKLISIPLPISFPQPISVSKPIPSSNPSPLRSICLLKLSLSPKPILLGSGMGLGERRRVCGREIGLGREIVFRRGI